MNMYGSSIKGKRDTNQDRFIIYQPNINTTFLAVADGMGGPVGGEIASELVIDLAKRVIEDSYKNPVKELKLKTILANIYEESQKIIKEKINVDPKLDGMGTTLSCVLICNDHYAWGNIGDSRIYLFKNKNIQQITKDHSMIEDYNKLEKPQLTRDMINYYGHFLTRSLNGGKHQADIFPFGLPYETLEKEQGIIICSDGLLNDKRELDNEVFNEIFKVSENPENFVNRLIDYSYNNGSNDNITCLTYWKNHFKSNI